MNNFQIFIIRWKPALKVNEMSILAKEKVC